MSCEYSCTGSCSDTCRSACSGTCSGICGEGCAGSCNAECKNSCGDNGCSYNCSGSCTKLCETNCDDNCKNKCYNCTGSCTGCTGTCSYGCIGTCLYTCNTTCTGTCDNACSSTSASDDIVNLGSNITIGKFISSADFKIIKAKIENELTRRNKSNLINRYSQSAEVGNTVMREHIDKIYNDIDNSGIQRTYNVGSDNIVRTSDLTNAISDIKILMLEKVNTGT